MVDEDKWLEITSLTNLRKTGMAISAGGTVPIGVGIGIGMRDNMENKDNENENQNENDSEIKRKQHQQGEARSGGSQREEHLGFDYDNDHDQGRKRAGGFGKGKENEEKMSIADSKKFDLGRIRKSAGEKNYKSSSSSSLSSPWPIPTPTATTTTTSIVSCPQDHSHSSTWSSMSSQPTLVLTSNNSNPIFPCSGHGGNQQRRKKSVPLHNFTLNLDLNESHSCRQRNNKTSVCCKNTNPTHFNANYKGGLSSVIATKSNPNHHNQVHQDAPKVQVIDENIRDKNSNNADIANNNSSNSNSITMKNSIEEIESRLTKLSNLLAEKIKIIEQQEMTIGNLHQKLAAQTTESLNRDFQYNNHSDSIEILQGALRDLNSGSEDNSENSISEDGESQCHNFSCCGREDLDEKDNMGLKDVCTMDDGQQLNKTDNNKNDGGTRHNNISNIDEMKKGHHEHEHDDDEKDACSTRIQKNSKRRSRHEHGRISMRRIKEKEEIEGETEICPSRLDDRIDTLVRKMDHLEAELPKRIRAICAEFIQRQGLWGCHCYKSDESHQHRSSSSSSFLMDYPHHHHHHTSSSSCSPSCPCYYKNNNNDNITGDGEIRGAAVKVKSFHHDDDDGDSTTAASRVNNNHMEFSKGITTAAAAATTTTTTSSQGKLNPMVTIMRKLCDKTTFSNSANPSNSLKWNKSPVIKPKTNLSANYRFLHHSAIKSGEGQKNFSNNNNNSSSGGCVYSKDVEDSSSFSLSTFNFRAVEEKVSRIEIVVDKFKQYLLSLLLSRFK